MHDIRVRIVIVRVLPYHESEASNGGPWIGKICSSKLQLPKVTGKHDGHHRDQVIANVSKNQWQRKHDLLLGLLLVQQVIPPPSFVPFLNCNRSNRNRVRRDFDSYRSSGRWGLRSRGSDRVSHDEKCVDRWGSGGAWEVRSPTTGRKKCVWNVRNCNKV